MNTAPTIKNKKAYHNFEITDKLEAGLVLQGTEVKSLREGNVSMGDSFVRVFGEELFLVNLHIAEYKQGGFANHDPMRKRKLLLHRREIKRLSGKVRERGFTMVPLRIYFNERGIAKVELGLCRGKRQYDKREAIRKRDQAREASREMRH
ncbi:MAG TPA: SsrA-binding protein [Planctomycetes bacterium]|jgi:SsrA-binding protein|nr:SsrA-binding protein [Planctomycetota bacterium]